MQKLSAAIRRLWNKTIQRLPLLRRKQQTQPSEMSDSVRLMRRSVLHKGLLAAATLVLAAVMLFAMTAAWYKNVAHSSGLVFQVNEWGLDSSVSIADELIGAAPGDTGDLAMSVENTSDGIISVVLNVGKGDLYNDIADMRKRLYFYVDDMSYRGGEHTPRVYLNSVETYAYTVLPDQKLVLGDNGNGASLKWLWVLDVLGYYFQGTVTTNGTAQVSEYLRPVEYDLDRATFRDGVLTTVDGTLSPMDFVTELSENDGFSGTVTETVTTADGRVYYPVSVDDQGKGVWIYLCNLGEIEYETSVDTRLGSADDAAQRRFETYLHVMAQQKQLSVVEAANEQQLTAALNDNVHDMVRLTADVELTTTLSLRYYGEKILDLGGHTISGTGNYMMIAYEDVSLTMMNGSLKGTDSAAYHAVTAAGSDVTLSNVTITDFKRGVYLADNWITTTNARVTLKGCEIRTSEACLYVLGNGNKTVSDSCVVVEDSLLETTGDFALTGNGTATYGGTDMVLRNTTLRGVTSAIYHPMTDSTLVLDGCVVEAATPIVIKGGDVEITDTTVTALTGAAYDDLIEAPSMHNSGFSCTGAAVYIETNYNRPCRVTIGGDSTLTSVHATAVLQYEDTNPQYIVALIGGTYSHDVSAYVADGYTCQKQGDLWVVSEAD